jgi:SAM-dependent methyltransferase
MSVAFEASISRDRFYQHGGTVLSNEPLKVETSPQQWDYAISLPLKLADHAPHLQRLPVDVAVKVTVESGELGCLIVGTDWRALAGAAPPTVNEGTHVVSLKWERFGRQAHLVFRNHGALNAPCVFTVHSVELTPGPEDPFFPTRLFEKVVAKDGRRLDLAKLRTAIEEPEQFYSDDKEIFDYLRRRWSIVPAGLDARRSASDLKQLPVDELRELWQASHKAATTGSSGFPGRGWYQALYRDVLHGKKVLEFGSGMGLDGIEFARHGAQMTFVDIVEDNLAVMERLCGIFGITDARFVYLEQLSSLDVLDHDYDVVWCQGSQINNPFGFARRECGLILRHLKSGGRWIELAYPKERWIREGSPPFRIWGTMTDGEGTPWVEWYDLDKLLRRLAPARFDPILSLNFHNDDFNWFDLVRIS